MSFKLVRYRWQQIKVNKKRRVKELSGKYVIACDSQSGGKEVFLQDKIISRGGYWTKFLSNAVGFTNLNQAESKRNSFKYGNPKIYLVDSNGNLRNL